MRYDNINLTEVFTMDTFIVSDHHFGHKFVESFEPSRNVVKQLDGFETFEEMLITRHNEVVGKDDIVVFLGDFSFNSPSNWASKLNGKKYLILGNHDRPSHQAYNQDFEYVFKGYHLNSNGYDLVYEDKFDGLLSAVDLYISDSRFIFCHYPIGQLDEYDWQREQIVSRNQKILEISDLFFSPYAYNYIIHGHTHSKNINVQGYHNVSVEVQDFRPKKLREIIKL